MSKQLELSKISNLKNISREKLEMRLDTERKREKMAVIIDTSGAQFPLAVRFHISSTFLWKYKQIAHSLKSNRKCKLFQQLQKYLKGNRVGKVAIVNKCEERREEVDIKQQQQQNHVNSAKEKKDHKHKHRASKKRCTHTFLYSLIHVRSPFGSVYCNPKNQTSRNPIVFTTWSKSCLPVVLCWMANSSSASIVVTRTFSCKIIMEKWMIR
jgi:hypothetical protein